MAQGSEHHPEAVARDMDRKALIRRLVEDGVNGGRFGVLHEVLASTCHVPLVDEAGPEGAVKLLALYRHAVPDACWTVEEQVGEGDTVVTRFTAWGTHRRPVGGLPATGRSMAVSGILISYWEGDRIAAQWMQVDLLGLLQQLRVMPDLDLDKAVTTTRVLKAGKALGEPGPDLR